MNWDSGRSEATNNCYMSVLTEKRVIICVHLWEKIPDSLNYFRDYQE